MKWGGVFCKKVDLSPQNETKLMLELFLFYILLIWGVRTHPTHPRLGTCTFTILILNSEIFDVLPVAALNLILWTVS